MATIKLNWEDEVQRAMNGGAKIHTSFKASGNNSMPSTNLNAITEGTIVTVPKGFKVIEDVIRGTTRTTCHVLTKECLNLYPGCFTRSAKSVDTGERVYPSGTVVEAAQNYVDMDEFFNKELVEKPICFTKKTPVVVQDFNNPAATQTVNVWQIDFVN